LFNSDGLRWGDRSESGGDVLMKWNRLNLSPWRRLATAELPPRASSALLALSFGAVVCTAASCGFSQSAPSQPLSQQIASPAAQSPRASASAQSKTCGIPPCVEYLSRSRTRTLDRAIGGHPIASGIALHLVVSAFCGGILCELGEGVGFVYVERHVHLAAQNGECLRVNVLPKGRVWQLVGLVVTDERPGCAD
jgi:hypothetical protein